MVSERSYVHCPSCGSYLMKCQGTCEIELVCKKCKQKIIVKNSEMKLTLIRFT